MRADTRSARSSLRAGLRPTSRRWWERVGPALVSDHARFFAFAFFVLIVAMMGGSSRSDIQSLIVLRPASVWFSAYALFCIRAEECRKVRFPLLLVASVMMLSLLQLLPLPTAIWTMLPGRQTVAKASLLVGMNDLKRPLSLDPARTWNTFFALFVPFASIGLAAIQAPSRRWSILPLLMLAAALSASLGYLQAVGGDSFQLYEIANHGYPIGLFANRNHQGVLLLWLMLAVSWFASTSNTGRHSQTKVIFGAVASILVLFPLLILTGSRAALLLSMPTLAIIAWLLLRSEATRSPSRHVGMRARLARALTLAVMVSPLLFVVGVLAVSNRETAISRLFQVDAADGLRWKYLPFIERMAFDFLPFGSGLGSFEKAFNAYEPADMLTASYMNQAHNDALQLVIEGGIPALMILIFGVFWLVLRCLRLWRESPAHRSLAIFLGSSIALWLAASLVDYPLRTPIGAMLIAVLTTQFALPSVRSRSGEHSSPMPRAAD